MKLSNKLAVLSLATALALGSLSSVVYAEASDAAKVDAVELTSELQLHPELVQYGLSVVAIDDDTLSIQGLIDEQRAYDVLNQLIDDLMEKNDWKIENNVSRV